MERSKLISLSTVLFFIMHLSPFYMRYRNMSIILLAAVVVFDKTIYNRIKHLFSDYKFYLLSIPFLIYACSLFVGESLNLGLQELEKKASLIVFPIIFGLGRIQLAHYKKILFALALLISIVPIIGFIHQIGIYSETGDSGWFYNDNLVSLFDKQAVYYAFYVNTAIVILLYLRESSYFKSAWQIITAVLSFAVLICTQFLLASRTSMGITFILLILYFIWIGAKKLDCKQIALVAFGLIFGAFLLSQLFPKVLNRFSSITQLEYRYDNPNPINHYNAEIKKENWNGFNTRLAIWNCAWEEFEKSPIYGYGIGDTQKRLIQNYTSKNFILGLNMNYNSHNQYLDILLAFGMIGFLFFLLYFVALFRLSLSKNNPLLLGFLITFVLSNFTENLLSRDQGVVFIAFILPLLLFMPKIDDKSISKQ